MPSGFGAHDDWRDMGSELRQVTWSPSHETEIEVEVEVEVEVEIEIEIEIEQPRPARAFRRRGTMDDVVPCLEGCKVWGLAGR